MSVPKPPDLVVQLRALADREDHSAQLFGLRYAAQHFGARNAYTAAAALLEAELRWRSVREELPPVEEVVLLASGFADPTEVMTAWRRAEGGWGCNVDDNITTVTVDSAEWFWHPLPKFPR